MTAKVLGLFITALQAHAVVDELSKDRVAGREISVLLPFSFDHQAGLFSGAGILSIAGFGSVIATGPLLVALKESARDSAAVRWDCALEILGVPVVQSARFGRILREGGVLLSVPVATLYSERKVLKVFRRYLAQEVCICVRLLGQASPSHGVFSFSSVLLATRQCHKNTGDRTGENAAQHQRPETPGLKS